MRGPLIAAYALMVFIAIVSVSSAAAMLFGQAHSNGNEWIFLITLLILAVAAPMVAGLHKSAYQSGIITLTAVLSLVWLCLMAMAAELGWAWIDSGKLEASLMILLFTGIPAAIALVCRSKPWGNIFCWTLVTVAAVGGLFMLMIIWIMPTDYEHQGIYQHLLTAALWDSLFLGIGSVLLINIGRGDRRYFRSLGMLAALFGAVIRAVTSVGSEKLLGWELTANICLWVAVSFAMVNILLMTSKPGLVRLMQCLAIALTLFSGAGMIVILSLEYRYGSEWSESGPGKWWYRVAFASTFLTIGSILCLLVARSALRILLQPTTPDGLSRLQLQCPNCHVTQFIGLDGACHHCLLRFHIKLAEPRCPQCNHLLLNLESDRCPECGFTVKRPVVATA